MKKDDSTVLRISMVVMKLYLVAVLTDDNICVTCNVNNFIIL